jgi:hypothetical protein
MRKLRFRWLVLACLAVGLAGMAGCDESNEGQIFIAPTLAPTRAPTAKPTATPTVKPTATPAGSPTPSATPTLAPAACLPSSSNSVLISGTDATAYIPIGFWEATSTATGVLVVPIETSSGIGTGGAVTTIKTPNVTNSCSSNSVTGQTVCVANNTDVYIITGTTLNKMLTSGATGTIGFSGGSCMNCGVIIDPGSNTAFITVGLSSNPRGGYQALDLATQSFSPPISSPQGVSEDIAFDPIRHLILSPSEGPGGSLSAFYEIVQTQPSTSIFENQIVPIPTPTPVGAPTDVGTALDSAGEDCTTGIAMATDEFTGNVFFADLTQATFTPGSPGTWSAPSQFVSMFPDEDNAAGTCGIAVSPGTHFAMVTSEFGGNLEGVMELPATSGKGIPAPVDWTEFTMPDPVSGTAFNLGFDPHTTTAYVSPNTGKALGVLTSVDSSTDLPNFLGIIDIQGILALPHPGHVISGPLPAGLVTYIKLM